MSTTPTLAPDAAIVLGIAATAIPFARTPEDEAERWLRVLRLHGEVGSAMQALGVSEESIKLHPENGHVAPVASASRAGESSPSGDADVIVTVVECASRIAAERGAAGVTTTDILLAVLDVYGPVFERALRAHGTDTGEVLERLAAA
jgi:hypothetical protein